MAVRGFLSKISGKGQRQKTDDAIDQAMGSKPNPGKNMLTKTKVAKPSPKPSAKSAGRSGGR